MSRVGNKPTGTSRTRYNEATDVVWRLFVSEQTALIDEEFEKPRKGPMPNTSNPPGAISPNDRTQGLDRYAEVSLADDTVVIYDRENPQRWVQSGVAVRLVEVR